MKCDSFAAWLQGHGGSVTPNESSDSPFSFWLHLQLTREITAILSLKGNTYFDFLKFLAQNLKTFNTCHEVLFLLEFCLSVAMAVRLMLQGEPLQSIGPIFSAIRCAFGVLIGIG